ncbi:MAG: SseB family protein [Lachnospiraceae bacterium]|nr:SseB family protein [Lachnospiraceae bacterium]
MKMVENDVINPALMLAISRMKENNNPETRKKMMDEMSKAQFLVPCDMKMKPGTENESQRNSSNTIMNFNMVMTDKEEKFFIAFTDTAEMQKWKKQDKQNVMIMKLEDVAKLISGAGKDVEGFVLNPATTNLIFRRASLADIADRTEKVVEEGNL